MSDTVNSGTVLSPSVCHQPSLLGGAENMKLLFDDVMTDLTSKRKAENRHADAWETLRLLQAQNVAVFSHAVNMGSVLAGQTGTTEGQAAVGPIRTGAGDNLAAGSAPANRVVDETGAVAAGAVNAALAGIATANQAIADALAKLTDATNAIVIAAAGIAAKNASGGA